MSSLVLSGIGLFTVFGSVIITVLAVMYAKSCNNEYEEFKEKNNKIINSITNKYYKLKDDYNKLNNSTFDNN